MLQLGEIGAGIAYIDNLDAAPRQIRSAREYLLARRSEAAQIICHFQYAGLPRK